MIRGGSVGVVVNICCSSLLDIPRLYTKVKRLFLLVFIFYVHLPYFYVVSIYGLICYLKVLLWILVFLKVVDADGSISSTGICSRSC